MIKKSNIDVTALVIIAVVAQFVYVISSKYDRNTLVMFLLCLSGVFFSRYINTFWGYFRKNRASNSFFMFLLIHTVIGFSSIAALAWAMFHNFDFIPRFYAESWIQRSAWLLVPTSFYYSLLTGHRMIYKICQSQNRILANDFFTRSAFNVSIFQSFMLSYLLIVPSFIKNIPG